MNHPPTYVRTFSLHKVRENCHFLDHPPTPMSLRNIKMAPNSNRLFFLIHQITRRLKSTASENSLADFWASANMKALKINLLFKEKCQMVSTLHPLQLPSNEGSLNVIYVLLRVKISTEYDSSWEKYFKN